MIRSLLVALALVVAAAPSAQIAYGDPIPLAGQEFNVGSSMSTLDQIAGPAGLVVVFWSNACPWTERYTPRLGDLVGTYVPAGIGMVLVNSNDPAQNERESAVATREWQAQSGVSTPYLSDPDGALAAAFGARNAPHAFFFGPDGTLMYDGAIDDSPAAADRVQVPYLAQAMDQSIAGMAIEVQRTQSFGCSIKR